MSTFLERVLTEAASFVGTVETSHNSGPHIDAWLALAGGSPGESWCAAFLHAMFGAAAFDFKVANPFPFTRSALRVWEKAADNCRRHSPQRGFVYVLDHGHGLGHVGIIEHIFEGGVVEDISGNTNAAGMREGDRVGRHIWNPESGSRGRLVGYLELGPRDVA